MPAARKSLRTPLLHRLTVVPALVLSVPLAFAGVGWLQLSHGLTPAAHATHATHATHAVPPDPGW